MKAMEARRRVSFQKILFTTDFSPVAKNASLYALEFARSYKAKVHALHVRPIEMYATAPPESWTALREATKALEEQQAAQLDTRFAGVQHETTVAEGHISDIVADYIVAAIDVALLLIMVVLWSLFPRYIPYLFK